MNGFAHVDKLGFGWKKTPNGCLIDVDACIVQDFPCINSALVLFIAAKKKMPGMNPLVA
jgi:hypothetical protein